MGDLQSMAKAAHVDGVAREHVADNGADGPRARKEKANLLAEVYSRHLPPQLAISPAEVERAILHVTPSGEKMMVGTLEEEMDVDVCNFKELVQPDGTLSYSFTFKAKEANHVAMVQMARARATRRRSASPRADPCKCACRRRRRTHDARGADHVQGAGCSTAMGSGAT